jgi:hypothetical protein
VLLNKILVLMVDIVATREGTERNRREEKRREEKPSPFKLIKITPYCECRRFVSQIIDKTIRNSKFRCLSEANFYYHNVFSFTLFLSEGRAGVAWELSNKCSFSLIGKLSVSHFTP